jgi:hypothetical protein
MDEICCTYLRVYNLLDGAVINIKKNNREETLTLTKDDALDIISVFFDEFVGTVMGRIRCLVSNLQQYNATHDSWGLGTSCVWVEAKGFQQRGPATRSSEGVQRRGPAKGSAEGL